MWNLDVRAGERLNGDCLIGGRLHVLAGHLVVVTNLAVGCTIVEPAMVVPEDASEVVHNYAEECRAGTLTSCYALGLAWEAGEEAGHGLERNLAHALHLLNRACEGGVTQACAAAAAIADGYSPGPMRAPAGMNALEGSGE
jgi:hypothetical protein